MTDQNPPPAQMRVVTVHLIAMLLGLAGTGLSLLQARYWLTHPSHGLVLWLVACVPLIAAVAFTIGPRHVAEDKSPFRPMRSAVVLGNLSAPVILTCLTVVLVGVSGRFDHFAGFAMLLAANAGRNLRDLVFHLWRGQ